MSDWIELKYIKSDGTVERAAIKTYQIVAIETVGFETCKVYIDEDYSQWYKVPESYDKLMKRIKEIEEYPPALVERFTKEEYELLLECVRGSKGTLPVIDSCALIEKLEQILKEEE